MQISLCKNCENKVSFLKKIEIIQAYKKGLTRAKDLLSLRVLLHKDNLSFDEFKKNVEDLYVILDNFTEEDIEFFLYKLGKNAKL